MTNCNVAPQRKNIYLDARQLAALLEIQQVTGASFSEVIRRAVAQMLSSR
jgi:hypothetical protein